MSADVPVRDAATVVLLRDGVEGIEAWLLTRVTQMVFAAGMSVFPGGRVDAADGSLPLAGGDVAGLAARLGCSHDIAHALIGAAVRETFEETGVLLSVPSADLSGAREDVELGRISFGDLLRENGLSVDADALHPWSRWVTPAGEVRRYDTRFFVGALPDAAVAQDVTSESSEASWLPIGAALEQARRGERMMLPPTMTTLVDLVRFPNVAEVLASSGTRSLDPVRPNLRVGDDGSVAVELPNGTLVPIPHSMLPSAERRRGSIDGAADVSSHPAYEVLRQVTPVAAVLLQANPGPMTLDGTNTWLLRARDSDETIVVDPGQSDEVHLGGLLAAAPKIAMVLLTHGHLDHSQVVAELHERTGAPVRALDPEHCHGGSPLDDGEVVDAAGVRVRVLATPGHSADSVSFVFDAGAGDAVLTGDTILGRGTTVVAHPDGELGAYLDSLARLRDLGAIAVLPGHGPELPEAGEVAQTYLTHREERLAQVRTALAQLGRNATARQIVELVYADVDQAVWWAAELSVEAQLAYLRAGT